jgi:hypothetical protein
MAMQNAKIQVRGINMKWMLLSFVVLVCVLFPSVVMAQEDCCAIPEEVGYLSDGEVPDATMETTARVEGAVREIFGRLPTSEDVASYESFVAWAQTGGECCDDQLYTTVGLFARYFTRVSNVTRSSSVWWSVLGFISFYDMTRVEGLPETTSARLRETYDYFLRGNNLGAITEEGLVTAVVDVGIREFLHWTDVCCDWGRSDRFSPLLLESLLVWSEDAGYGADLVRIQVLASIEWVEVSRVRSEEFDAIVWLLLPAGDTPSPWCE